jgi:hypothetical protein
MRRTLAVVVSASFVAGVSSGFVAADANGLTSTGLFPVYDSSGETHGDDLAGYLTPAIYRAFKETGRELVLMNPGGNYSLLDEAASLEYGRSAGVQFVLISRLAPTRRSKPDDASPSLQVEVKAVDVTSGTTLQSFTVSQQVNRKDLEKGFDKGPGTHQFLVVLEKTSDKSRSVEKQALGKTVRRIAEAIRTNVLAFTGAAVLYPSAALHPGPFPPSCEVAFSVRYTRHRSSSKGYTLFVNDRDESTSVNFDGAAALTLIPGLNMFEVAVKDPPYRLALQKRYVMNRWVECSAQERHLVLEIGGGGEALLVAKP